MPLPLPQLDTRRFGELLQEARDGVPRRAPAWTDHNLSDPGITIIELLASEADRLAYAINRVTDRDRRALLRLIGFAPLPPAPATAVASFALRAGASPLTVPAGLVLEARDVDAPPAAAVALQTLDAVHVGTAGLRAVQTQTDGLLRDRTVALANGEPFEALGHDPAAQRGSALLLGLSPPPPVGEPLSLWFDLGVLADDARVREDHGDAAVDAQHGAAIAWEIFDGADWVGLPVVRDTTRALTHDGAVVVQPATPAAEVALGSVAAPRAWLRCRLANGRQDAAPVLRRVVVHATPVRQAMPATTRFVLAAGCVVAAGEEPVAGTVQALTLSLDADGHVSALAATDPAGGALPGVRIFDHAPATAGAEGHLLAAAVVAGRGERRPGQRVLLPGAPVIASSVQAWCARATTAEPVAIVPTLDAAGPHDLVAELDASSGELRFGDGRRGRMLAPDELVLAGFERTMGAAARLRALPRCRVAGVDDDVNRSRLGGQAPAALDLRIEIALPLLLAGAADAETPVRAAGRAARRLHAHERLIELLEPDGAATLDGLDPAALVDREAPERILTGPDLERIVLDTAGARVARARAWTELDPALPALRAAGTATVVVLPSLPAGRPEPTAGLLAAVQRGVERRRVVGSRILVVGPTYVEVAVHVVLRAVVGAAADAVQSAAAARIDELLHPLHGGRSGRGWPFGRDVHRSDLLAMLDGVPGVDRVLSLELVEGGTATCGDVCVAPTALVAAGEHRIEVQL